jgi:hypothetical protein
MAYWDGKKIVYWEPRTVEGIDGWEEIDCGCCKGIEWGGEYPRECRRCGGGGVIWRHKKSGVLAEYPGGKFLGRECVSAVSHNDV